LREAIVEMNVDIKHHVAGLKSMKRFRKRKSTMLLAAAVKMTSR
jgi:hypothetical protein